MRRSCSSVGGNDKCLKKVLKPEENRPCGRRGRRWEVTNKMDRIEILK
jgi:hypothetical protein